MVKILKIKSFWKNKRVLVTGHTGFKGSWICILLNFLGAKVYGYSLKPKKKSLFLQTGIGKKIDKSYFKDINNLVDLKRVINSHKPEIIFHLASEALVLDSYQNPYKTFKTNLLGTLNLLEILNNSNYTKSAVFVTTDKVYMETKKKIYKYSENDQLGGKDPYSSSKVGQELLVNSYINSFFKNKNLKNRVSTARSGNVIGGGDYSKYRLIPDLLNSINNNKKFIIRNPNHIRPWQHVIEPIYGYLNLAKKQYKGEIHLNDNTWNFGPKDKNFVNVKEVIKKFKSLGATVKSEKIKIKKNNFIETNILKLNSKKAKKYLNWESKWNLELTLKKVLEWNTLKKNNMAVYNICTKQIKEYFNFN